jgi:hypothetical protein
MLASFTVLTLTVLNAHYIKTTLYKSNVYQNVVPAALDLVIAKTDATSSDNLNPQLIKELEPTVSSAISPQFLQKTGEAVIDGSFAWLNGSAQAPNFTIETSTVKSSLHTELVSFIQKRVAGLPVCPRGTNYNDFDPLSASCKPPAGVNSTEIEQNVAKFIDQIPLFQKTDISLQSLGAIDAFAQDKPIQKVPMIFTVITNLPFAFVGLILTSGLFLILLSVDKRRSWRTIGHTFAWAGILLVIASAATLFFANKFSAGFIGNASTEQAHFANTIFSPITKLLTTTVAIYSLYFGVGYCLVGTVCYVIAHRIRHNESKDAQASENTATEPKSNAPLSQGL